MTNQQETCNPIPYLIFFGWISFAIITYNIESNYFQEDIVYDYSFKPRIGCNKTVSSKNIRELDYLTLLFEENNFEIYINTNCTYKYQDNTDYLMIHLDDFLNKHQKNNSINTSYYNDNISMKRFISHIDINYIFVKNAMNYTLESSEVSKLLGLYEYEMEKKKKSYVSL